MKTAQHTNTDNPGLRKLLRTNCLMPLLVIIKIKTDSKGHIRDNTSKCITKAHRMVGWVLLLQKWKHAYANK